MSSVINGMNILNNFIHSGARKEVLTKIINKQLILKKIRQNNIRQRLIQQQNNLGQQQDNLEQPVQQDNLEQPVQQDNLEQHKITQNNNKKYSVGKIHQKGKITIIQ
jgi:hypothetical protein